MKRNKLLLAAMMLMSVATIHAQFTLRIAGGYAGPGFQNNEAVLGPKVDPATPAVDALVTLANINDSAKTYKQIHGSYGTGGNVTVAVGYMFNRFIGIDVAVGYGHSQNISCTQVRTLPYPLTGYLTANISSHSYAITLSPSLVITGEKMGWKVYPYGRMGIILPVAGKLTDNVSIDCPVSLNVAPFWLGNHTDVKLVTQGTISLGMNAAIGVAYRPLPFMNIFLEVTGQYLNVRGKSSTVEQWTATTYNANGTTTVVSDQPTAAAPGGSATSRSVYRTQYNYVNSLNPQSNNAQYNTTYDATKAKEDTRPTSPGSNLGFNVGVTFFLGKNTLKKTDKTKTAVKS